MGLVRAERLQEEFPVEMDVCAYDLHPGLPPEGLPREEAYPSRKSPPEYFERLRQMAAEAGIRMDRPEVIANTRKAHEATEFARAGGHLQEYQRALFRSYWEEGDNIGDVEVLCRVAAGCGLDADDLRLALAQGRYAAAVDEQIAWSRAVGISGVPTFVINNTYAVVGAQDYETFRDIASRITSGELKAEG
ncbi:MAG: DsbA family oxidoreductase [Dehalococcoidia bacterium]